MASLAMEMVVEGKTAPRPLSQGRAFLMGTASVLGLSGRMAPRHVPQGPVRVRRSSWARRPAHEIALDHQLEAMGLMRQGMQAVLSRHGTCERDVLDRERA